MALSAKMRAFVEAYDGNGTAACRAAGYKGSDAVLATQAGRLLRKAEIRAAIDSRRAKSAKGRIADREERQRFWSKVMRSKRFELKDRLKASELLGRSEADFIEKHEHGGPDGSPLVVQVVSFADPEESADA